MKRIYTKVHRRIYEEHYRCSLIPYVEIHHIDGNHKNNNIENLLPVTVEEHYLLHLENGDKAAAALIGIRAGIAIEIRTQLNREQAIKNNSLGLTGFKLGHASSAGKLGGKKSGNLAKEKKTGIFALTPEQNRIRHYNSVVSKMIKQGKASAWPRKIIC
jgi:hypothetical protein